MTSGLDTVGVRVPAHPAAHALIAAAGTPVAAPSANPFGYVSPTTAAHVAELLGRSVDLVLDGGPCRVGVESTILSLATHAAGHPAARRRPARGPRGRARASPGGGGPGGAAARARAAPEALRHAHAAAHPPRARRPRPGGARPRRAPGVRPDRGHCGLCRRRGAGPRRLAGNGRRPPLRRAAKARRGRARPHPRRALRRGGPRPRDHGPAATGLGPARGGRRAPSAGGGGRARLRSVPAARPRRRRGET